MSYSEATINRKIHTVVDYVKNKSIKADFMQRIKPNGSCVYVIKGEEFERKIIDAQFPTDVLLNVSENYDRSRNWLSGIKSY